jgi:antitoxin MazE
LYILATVRTRIVKWGNSLGLRIPKSFAEEVEVRSGSTVDLSISDGKMVIRPIEQRFRLEELLEVVTEDNLPAEIPTGEPRGRESW